MQVEGFLQYTFELTGLYDPRQGNGFLLMSTGRLRVAQRAKLRDCFGARVLAEGYLTHIPTRGGERTIFIAEAIGLPRD